MKHALVVPLLASLALPAAAESFSMRFGLGLQALFEHQESLEVSAFRGSIRARDLLRGTEESGPLPGDPAFLNRKFSLLWELEGAGVALPVELPKLGGLSSKLVLEAAVADVNLDFLGRVTPEDNSSLSGRGPLFGIELGLDGSPWGASPWSVGGTLRWQKLPSLTMDRSPAFGPEGFDVLADDVRLSQEVQELTLRSGYASSGNTTWYTGVRYRRSDVTIEDELSYADSFQEIETRLASTTELESEATLAVAGIEAHPRPRLYGRVETAIGEGNRIVLANVTYLFPTGREREEMQRDREITDAIAPRLAEIEAEFLAGWHRLTIVEGPDGKPAYFAREVEDLLTRTERDLLMVLDRYPELEALGDWVQYEFGRARAALGLQGLALFASQDPQQIASFLRQHVTETTLDQQRADEELLKLAQGPIRTLVLLPEDGLSMQLTFRTPLGRGTTLYIYPMAGERASLAARRLNRDEPTPVKRGSYYFEVARGGRILACCGGDKCALGNCPLPLALPRCVVLACDDLECRKREGCR